LLGWGSAKLAAASAATDAAAAILMNIPASPIQADAERAGVMAPLVRKATLIG
jgi:hypothetical protein